MFVNYFAAYADQKYTIYFHNPETNINNYALLKKEFDKYLSDYGPFEFQPFSNKKTFEKHIIWDVEGIYLIPSWYYKLLSDNYPIEAMLVGVSNGKTTHKKILCSEKSIANLDLLENSTIASSGSEEYTKNILIQMLGEREKEAIYSLKILTVPKDIDALMAVGFGIAGYSLTTGKSLLKLKGINPKQYELLIKLAISDEILLPIVAVQEQPDSEIRMLVTIIDEMEMSPEGKKKLKMLGLDGWEKLGVSEKELLEK